MTICRLEMEERRSKLAWIMFTSGLARWLKSANKREKRWILSDFLIWCVLWKMTSICGGCSAGIFFKEKLKKGFDSIEAPAYKCASTLGLSVTFCAWRFRSPASPGFSSEGLTNKTFHGINTDPYEAAIKFSPISVKAFFAHGFKFVRGFIFVSIN